MPILDVFFWAADTYETTQYNRTYICLITPFLPILFSSVSSSLESSSFQLAIYLKKFNHDPSGKGCQIGQRFALTNENKHIFDKILKNKLFLKIIFNKI
jgi:hypothetical protein